MCKNAYLKKFAVMGLLLSIGCAVAERARALGVRVLGMKRSGTAGAASDLAERIFPPSQLHEMLALCDAVVVAAPATPEMWPPPPMGATIMVTSGHCSRISSPALPAPAMIWGSSNGWM